MGTKWVLGQMLVAGSQAPGPTQFQGTPIKKFTHTLSQTKNISAIASLVGLSANLDEYPANAHTTVYYRNYAFESEACQSKRHVDDSEVVNGDTSNFAKRFKSSDE